MNNTFNENSTDRQRLLSAMKGVEQQLAVMAPDPNRVGHKGPCFVKKDMRVGTGNDQEAILGNFLLESFLGAALGEVFADTAMDVPEILQQVDWGNVIEIYDEFIQDRYSAPYSLGNKSSINGTFNSFSCAKPLNLEELFNQNIDNRLKLEEAYANFSHELDQLEQIPNNLPSLAA